MRLSFEYWQTLSPEQQREWIEMGRKFFEQYFGDGWNY
jgi:ABC-type transporter MlaC component